MNHHFLRVPFFLPLRESTRARMEKCNVYLFCEAWPSQVQIFQRFQFVAACLGPRAEIPLGKTRVTMPPHFLDRNHRFTPPMIRGCSAQPPRFILQNALLYPRMIQDG